MEFAVDTINSYIDAERDLFKVPRGRFLLSLPPSTNMLIYEKGTLKMNFDE